MATMAMPISSIPQNMRMLTIPVAWEVRVADKTDRKEEARPISSLEETPPTVFSENTVVVGVRLAGGWGRPGEGDIRLGPRILAKSAMRAMPHAVALEESVCMVLGNQVRRSGRTLIRR